MKVGDLIYHVDDWNDKKPVVGLVLGFNLHNEGHPSYRVKIIFNDKNMIEWWPSPGLRRVELGEYVEITSRV
tara:strand:+ start:410 stop:625 length:216 start_codon:yes stop_codon:yes gene_type:complete